MRPIAGGELFSGRPRKPSIAESQTSTPLPGPGHGTPTTYFLTHDSSRGPSLSSLQPVGRGKESTYRVQSLEDTIGTADEASWEATSENSNDLGDTKELLKDIGKARDESNECNILMEGEKTCREGGKPITSSVLEEPTTSPEDICSAQKFPRRFSQNTISQPLTPLFLASPAPGSSTPGSPVSTSTKSFRHPDEDCFADGTGNQAIISTGEEDSGVAMELMDSAPQLIMPSIRMPSRRPFTVGGKNMGKLKVIIAGDSGVGKTSLIKSIVQTCNDIVHVDPISPVLPTLHDPRQRISNPRGMKQDASATKNFTEVYASTRPYPSWWSDFDESKILRRRKSMGDTVLERNLCFVDTHGLASGVTEHINAVVQYIESQFERTILAMDTNDGDTLSLLSGNGGFHVDVIFYLISENIKTGDIEFMRRVSPICNIIPLVAKADLLSPDQLAVVHSMIVAELRNNKIETFPCDNRLSRQMQASTLSPLFAVSSSTASDAEIMDASLLMSPDYVQPLVPSELANLVEQVFQQERIVWLRHAAAKKFIQWRAALGSIPMSPNVHSPLRPASHSSARLGTSTSSLLQDSQSNSSSSQVLVSYVGSNSSYALARVADHTQREESLAQVRLAKWAADLQRSLENEKERYEALVKGERAVWLTERLGECVLDGTLVPVTSAKTHLGPGKQSPPGGGNIAWPLVRDNAMNNYNGRLTSLNIRDPLGLVEWDEGIRKKGWVALQMLGSFGIIGALAMLFAKSKGLSGDTLVSWNWSWWGGGA